MPDMHIQEFMISPKSHKEDYFGEIGKSSSDEKQIESGEKQNEKDHNPMKPILLG